MATTGDRFEMPDGSVYTVLRASADTGGAFVEMEFELPVTCVPPPPHTHRNGVEEYEVIEGRFDVLVGGAWSTLGPRETASVPVGALHTFRNTSGATVRVGNWHRPAMGFDTFIETMCTTLRHAGVTRPRDPRIPIYLSKVFLDFPETLEPGRRRERIGMRAMAGIAKMLP